MQAFDPLAGVIIALCGLAIGVLSGIFGIGGGTMIVPLFNLVFGLPMIASTSTSLFTIVPTAISGAIQHVRQKTAHLKVGIAFGVTGAAASVFSALFADRVPDIVLALLAAAVIIYSSVRMFLAARKAGAGGQGREEQAPPAASLRGRSLAVVMCIGVVAGIMAGLVGIGGGFIIVPFSIAYLGFSMKDAAGTSLVAIAVIAVPGIVTHALLGHIEWFYGIALVVGTIPGAQIGAWLVPRIPERVLRAAFGALLLCTGGLMVLNNIGL